MFSRPGTLDGVTPNPHDSGIDANAGGATPVLIVVATCCLWARHAVGLTTTWLQQVAATSWIDYKMSENGDEMTAAIPADVTVLKIRNGSNFDLDAKKCLSSDQMGRKL